MVQFLAASSTLLLASFALGLIGLALAILADHIQTIAKYQGVVKKRIAAGYNLAMKVMVLNRLGAVIYFLFIAYNIDSGLEPKALTLGLTGILACCALVTLVMMLSFKRRVRSAGTKQEEIRVAAWPKLVAVATFVATICNLLGLTIPWIAGALYPEWRLTLANTSFLFNTLFTVINVFFIEHHFAKLADSKDDRVHAFVLSVFVARFFAFLLVIALLAVLEAHIA